MRASPTPFYKNVLSLCRYCLVIPTLAALGCASQPNLIPAGADEFVGYPGVRNVVAAIDYPIVQTVETTTNDYNKVPIRWTYRGARVWGEKPFAKANRVQFILRQPGGSEILCDSHEIKNTGKEYEDYTCEFDVKKYTAEPLVGELSYWFGEKTEDDVGPESVMRVYYLIEMPKPKN